MKSFHRLLVPTDFSPSADQAFSFALLLARAAPATIHLLHDVEIPVETITAATIIKEELEKAKIESRQKMEALLASHRTSDLDVKRVIERSTNPVRSIPFYAEEHDIDLIVMGAHGHHSLKEKLLGSRAERVLREAPCPVITVAPPGDRVPTERITHIVVPVDFSEASIESVRVAQEVAEAFGARLSLLHADAQEREAIARQKLHEVYARATGAEGSVETFVSEDAPADAILTLAEETGADLIVMATHGRTGLKRVLTGNVADEVVPRAPCPVLTIPVNGATSGKHA